MRANIQKAMGLLKPPAQDSHALHAAHSEIANELVKLEAQAEAGKAAVLYFLHRLKRDEIVRYHCGFGTETFALMRKAAALFLDQTEEQVEHYVFEEDSIPIAR